MQFRVVHLISGLEIKKSVISYTIIIFMIAFSSPDWWSCVGLYIHLSIMGLGHKLSKEYAVSFPG